MAAHIVDLQSILQTTPAPSEFSSNRKNNNLFVVADFTQPQWNTVGRHQVLQLNGAVRVRIIPFIAQNCASQNNTATVKLGFAYQTDKLIGATPVANLSQNNIWQSNNFQAPDRQTNQIIDYILVGVTSIGIDIGTENLTAGQLSFRVFWEPMDNMGNVMPGNGGNF